MGTAQPRSRAAYGAWALTALLSTLLLVAVPVDPLLDRLGIHKGLSRGTIGYVRLLKVAHMPVLLYDSLRVVRLSSSADMDWLHRTQARCCHPPCTPAFSQRTCYLAVS